MDHRRQAGRKVRSDPHQAEDDEVKKNKWPDFLFTIAVRFLCGIVMGGLACFLFTWRGILRSFSHDNTRGPLIWLGLCGLIGGLVAVFTVPRWQTPWYKGIGGRDDDDG